MFFLDVVLVAVDLVLVFDVDTVLVDGIVPVVVGLLVVDVALVV